MHQPRQVKNSQIYRLLCIEAGTTRLERVEENIVATTLELTAGEMRELDELTSAFVVIGDRYPAEVEKMTNR